MIQRLCVMPYVIYKTKERYSLGIVIDSITTQSPTISQKVAFREITLKEKFIDCWKIVKLISSYTKKKIILS